jgi:hypothetical protein
MVVKRRTRRTRSRLNKSRVSKKIKRVRKKKYSRRKKSKRGSNRIYSKRRYSKNKIFQKGGADVAPPAEVAPAAPAKVAPVEGQITKPFSNEVDFHDKESKYLQQMADQVKGRDMEYFSTDESGKVSIEDFDKKFKDLLTSTSSKGLQITKGFEVGLGEDNPDFEQNLEKLKNTEVVLDEQGNVQFSLLTHPLRNEGGKVLVPQFRKLDKEVETLPGKGQEGVLHLAYHDDTNKVLQGVAGAIEPINFPLTIGTRDIHPIGNRLLIPYVAEYMRGIVDLKSIKVYVNFNNYKYENEYKEKVFSMTCTDTNCLYYWIPISDYSTPNIRNLLFWVHLCKYCRENNLRMIYHCGGGHGRTVFMTFCNLLFMVKMECINNDVTDNIMESLQELLSFVEEHVESISDKEGTFEIDEATGMKYGRVYLPEESLMIDKVYPGMKGDTLGLKKFMVLETINGVNFKGTRREALKLIKNREIQRNCKFITISPILNVTPSEWDTGLRGLSIYGLLMNLFNQRESILFEEEFLGIHGASSPYGFNSAYELLVSRLRLAIELLSTLDRKDIPDNEFNPFGVEPEEWLSSMGF